MIANATPTERAANAGEKFVLAAGAGGTTARMLATLDAAACLARWPVVMAGALDGPNGAPSGSRHAEAPGALSRAELRR